MADAAAFDPTRFATPEEQERWFGLLAKTIAVDFDGVLHPYTEGWTGSVPADEPPTPGALVFLQHMVDDGYRVVVISTRCDHPEGMEGVNVWLRKTGLHRFVSEVTCQKPAAVAYVDDRAVPFVGDWAAVEEGVAKLAAGRPHGAGGG